MAKLLILVTRQFGEFDDYWLYEPLEENCSELAKCGGNYVLIIRGEGPRETALRIQRKVQNLAESTLAAVDEIGVALHACPGVGNLRILEKDPVFQEKYSSGESALCVSGGDNFAAITDNDVNEKVLDAFRYHLRIYKEDDREQKLGSSFIALWNYFAGDKVLEKKLEFLHFCLDNSEQTENLSLDNWSIKELFQEYQNAENEDKPKILRDMRDILLKPDE